MESQGHKVGNQDLRHWRPLHMKKEYAILAHRNFPGAVAPELCPYFRTKYIVPESIIPSLRNFLKPFVSPDPNGNGLTPEYTVTTLHLDSPTARLHLAQAAHEALERFELRVRAYGKTAGECPYIFMEIKRMLGSTVDKSRCKIPWSQWSAEMLTKRHRQPFKLDFSTAVETDAFFEFVRLTNTIGAVPKVLIRCERESYVSEPNQYAPRVTIDRNIRYCPTEGYTLFPERASWWSIDTAASSGRNCPCVALELKTYSNEVPKWMLGCVRRFNLVQTGFCKYSAAMDMEARFTGEALGYTDIEETW